MPKTRSPQTGLIGWFDILGYRQILEHNDPGIVFDILGRTLSKIPNEISQGLIKPSKPTPASPIIAPIGEKLEWLPFSDTILVTLPCSTDLNPVDRARHFFLFIHVCQRFLNGMFVNGAPMRGTIHYGEYLMGRVEGMSEKVFAGKGIVEAEGETSQQDWAGCILSKRAEVEKDRIAKSAEAKFSDTVFRQILIRYPVPFKARPSEHRLVLNWLFPMTKPKELIAGQTLRAIVTEKFSSHGKAVRSEDISKVNNTELFLSFCQMEHNRWFRRGSRGRSGPQQA